MVWVVKGCPAGKEFGLMCCCQVLDGLIEFKMKWGDVFMSGVVGVAGQLVDRQGAVLASPHSPFSE